MITYKTVVDRCNKETEIMRGVTLEGFAYGLMAKAYDRNGHHLMCLAHKMMRKYQVRFLEGLGRGDTPSLLSKNRAK